MVKSDLYIHGTDADLNAVKMMVVSLAERMGCDTSDESALNIPMGMVMEVLVGDGMHIGLLIGLNTEDPECVVQTTLEEMRQAFPCDKLNQYYSGRYYQDLFYPSRPDTVDEGGYEILQYTAGKHIGKEARAKWDFYLDTEWWTRHDNISTDKGYGTPKGCRSARSIACLLPPRHPCHGTSVGKTERTE